MATVDEPLEVLSSPSRVAEWFARFETALAKVGDRLNPILVKEARQALKSRQFTITFILVLVAGWCWSILGLAWMGPGVYWSSDGASMFYGYFLILAFPLTVIVPYGAFRSLASEREDRTYELLSITTLRPTQVIGGKLAGAVLQMVVYLSAISPCLAFTYLLRGIDVVTIVTVIVYLFFGSLGLSMLCLMLATATTEKYQQVVLSVGIVFALGYAFVGTCILAGVLLNENVGFDDKEFWIVNAAMLSVYLSYFVFCFLAAATQLAFVGSNRSTPLRIVAIVQQAIFLAWMSGLTWYEGRLDDDVIVIALILLGVHWYGMGVFMTGEPSQLSPRVKRSLPQSFLGRAFLTWFNPGPASGYMFALSSYVGAILLIGIGCLWLGMGGLRTTAGWAVNCPLTAVLCLSYLAIYLGVGRVLLAWLGRHAAVTAATRVLIHVLLIFVSTVVPLTIQLTLSAMRQDGYTLLQATNPFWTLAEATSYSPAPELWMSAVLLGIAGVIVFMFNLPAVAEEVRQVRIAAPTRVAEEDAELAAAIAPSGPVKKNPWD